MKKMYFFKMTAVTMMVCFTSFTAEVAAFSGTGSGIPGDAYVITTVEQLVEINDAPTACYELGANIDLTDYIAANWPTDGWQPLTPNESSNGFGGTLDGKGYAITGLWINRPALVCAGLFGSAKAGTATFKNLAIKAATNGIYGFKQVGGLLGGVTSTPNYGTTVNIENCSFEGDVSGRRAVGGFVGYSYKGVVTLLNCYAGGSVTIKHVSDDGEKVEAVGGLIGAGWNSNTVNIINCYATNTITAISNGTSADAGENVGGLIGMQGTSGTVGNPPANTTTGEKDKLKAAQITIENSVAINPSVTSNGTAGRVHRIGGWIKSLPIPGLTNSTLTNNKALAVMETADKNGNVAIVSDGVGADGLDISADDLKLRSTFETDLDFDFLATWEESGNAYPFPVLQAIRIENRPTVIPPNLSAIFTTLSIDIQPTIHANILFDASTNLLKVSNNGVNVTIFDALGRLVTSTTTSEINLSGLSSGLYIVKVNNQSLKILKQ